MASSCLKGAADAAAAATSKLKWGSVEAACACSMPGRPSQEMKVEDSRKGRHTKQTGAGMLAGAMFEELSHS
jgi:hypothetical protein